MNLIIKPTEACNFSCTFCSSSYLVNDKKARLDLQYVYDFLKRFPETNKIFVVGGDPLMMPVEYYWEIINHIEENGYDITICFTTNLWDFWKKPQKWEELFRHPRMEIGTSFQYGDGRQITPGKVFTQEIFEEIYRLFKRHVPNKDLCFLAVIDESNKHRALDHVLLAKKLNTQCKITYANMSGKATSAFPVSEMADLYIQIWKAGLSEYEQSCYTQSERYRGIGVGCNIDRACDKSMRSLNPDGRYFSCGPLNDDLDPENEIDFKREMAGEMFFPVQNSKHKFLKEECFGCKMFEICNGCVKHIKDLKAMGAVERHCTKMKSIEKDFIEMAESSAIKELIRVQRDRLDEVEYAKNSNK